MTREEIEGLVDVAKAAAEHLPGEWRTDTDEDDPASVAFLDRHAGEERWLSFAHCSGGCLEWVCGSAHIAAFDPPTALRLLAALQSLAAERDEARTLISEASLQIVQARGVLFADEPRSVECRNILNGVLAAIHSHFNQEGEG